MVKNTLPTTQWPEFAKNGEGYCAKGMFGTHRLEWFIRSQTMTFEDFWGQVPKLKILQDEALRLVPDALSSKTKNRLCRKNPAEVAEIVQWAINQINHGSLETMDALVNRRY